MSNGFFRQFTGHVGGAAVEATARHDGDGEQVRSVLTNGGTAPVRLTVTDGYGTARKAAYRLRPGERVVHVAQVRRAHGWYDLAVLADNDSGFLRRLAGHVETGRPSTSDPAIATA